jgi:hypothetical protein
MDVMTQPQMTLTIISLAKLLDQKDKHDYGNEDRWFQPLQEDVAEWLEESIRDKEK